MDDVFVDDFQILVRKIIAHKPSFRGNEQLKHHYTNKQHDQYYVAIAHSALPTSDQMESFTQFCGHLALTFSGRRKLGKISSWAASIEASSSVISEESQEPSLSKTPNNTKTK